MFRIIAIVLLVIFYGIYYGKLFWQKKQGITTMQIKEQKKGSERIIGSLMGIATLLVPIGDALSIVLNQSILPTWARIIGVAVAAMGDLIFLLAVVTMGNSWRAGVSRTEKTELITHGIYKISRNPAFLGFYLGYIGILLMFFSWWLCLLTVFAIVMLHLQVVMVEEPFLPSVFGEEYVSYRKKVCRYLGRRA